MARVVINKTLVKLRLRKCYDHFEINLNSFDFSLLIDRRIYNFLEADQKVCAALTVCTGRKRALQNTVVNVDPLVLICKRNVCPISIRYVMHFTSRSSIHYNGLTNITYV